MTKPVPPEFREEFLKGGWRHIEHIYGKLRCNRRWIALSGGKELLRERRAIMAGKNRPGKS